MFRRNKKELIFASKHSWLKRRVLGFTLIELLVVIAIIGILSTIIVVYVNGARAKTRDAKRKAELRSIVTALELYRATYGHYPITEDEEQCNPCTWEQSVPPPSQDPAKWLGCLVCDKDKGEGQKSFANDFFGGTVPRDPINTVKTNNGPLFKDNYVYAYFSMGECYNLISRLENSSDSNTTRNSCYTLKCPIGSQVLAGVCMFDMTTNGPDCSCPNGYIQVEKVNGINDAYFAN